MTPAEFDAWLHAARPGDRIVYMRGYLAKSAAPDARIVARNALALAGYKRRSFERQMVWERCGPALVDLVQKRIGPNDYEYIAVRRV